MADLSKLSNEDLKALKSGDISRISNAGLIALRGDSMPSPGTPDKNGRTAIDNIGAGIASGFADIGDTLLNVGTYLPGKVVPAIKQWNDERSASLEQFNKEREDSPAFNLSRLGTNVAATLPVGNVLGAGVRAVSTSPKALALARALETGGFKTGAPAATTAAEKAADLGIRTVGGGVTGAASGGLIDPDSAGASGIIGAALPGAISAAGKTGSALAGRIAGQGVDDATRAAVSSARDAGYVIPPSQANPTLLNRALEGLAGKISTAQNASAKNQPITNELAKKAIGAKDLTPEGIAAVRDAADKSYGDLAAVGIFTADDDFAKALDKAGASSAEMRKNFPELINTEVDDLIASLKSRPEFDAQSTIEAIKQFRSSANANKASADPAKKRLGKAQNKISNAFEDLIDRNLQESGQVDLLQNYRDARKTLAKVYDVEKSLNKETGNVNAQKLAQALNKGRPLTGELREIAAFASRFPKAAQPVERMGSLPQVSPLDFGALGAMSAATSNPALMAGVLARPAARMAALSNPVQNRLAQDGNKLELLAELLSNPTGQQLVYRGAPALGISR